MRIYRAAWLALIAACGGGDNKNTSGIPDDCNPLGGQGCMLPYPSMAYVKDDPASATGIRLDLPPAAMPVNVDGIPVSPDTFNRRDGYSALGPFLYASPTGVSDQGLPGFKDPAASLAADAPIVVIDMASGERVPLFAEIDQNVIDPIKRNLIIRPLARLHGGGRYAVAIRNTVKALDGSDLPVSEGFAAIRDGSTTFKHPLLDKLAARYDDIFTALEGAGVDRGELVVAWDFVVASDELLRSDLTTMREQALAAMGTNGANLTFAATTQPNSPTSFKRYTGTFTAPNFLTNGEADASVMIRDANGAPMMNGLRSDARFAAIIPDCVQTQPLPRPTIIFGHGLFGSAEEYLNDDFVAQLAEDHCFVIIAGDFIGLTSRQLALAPLAVNDLNRGPQIADKLGQSVIDFMALENLAHGPMAQAPEFQFNGQSVIDTSNIFYVGGSLGGIMGNTIMAYDPNLTRAVLAVPGANWWMMIERSNAWSLLIGAAQGAYPDSEIYQLSLSMALGMGLEPFDPLTTAAHVIKDPLFGNPTKNVLMWYSLGDCLVTNISTEMVAREMGIQVLGPSVKSPYGLAPVSGPLENGITVYDDHPTPLPPETNTPPLQDNGTHSGINKKPAPLRQVEAFLLQGQQAADECLVANAPAPCDCATGACD